MALSPKEVLGDGIDTEVAPFEIVDRLVAPQDDSREGITLASLSSGHRASGPLGSQVELRVPKASKLCPSFS